MNPVWCVSYRLPRRSFAVDEPMKYGWCATYRGRKPDPEATSDKTRCGVFVLMRMGSARRQPTCPECRKR